MKILENQIGHITFRYCRNFPFIQLLALILLAGTYVPVLSAETNKLQIRTLFVKAIDQLNSGNLNRFSSSYNQIIKLTKYDINSREQVLADSIFESKKLIQSKEYPKGEQLLLGSLLLDPNGNSEAIKILIVLKSKMNKFDDIEPVLNQYFNLMSQNEYSRWYFNLVRAQTLTYAGNICEHFSQPEQAEYFFRRAIRTTTDPVPASDAGDQNDLVNKSYYWARVYAQACLGKLLIKTGQEKDGNLILSSVKEILARENKAKLNPSIGNGDMVSFVLSNRDRYRANAILDSIKTKGQKSIY